jgi:hypothetical protein
MSSDQTKRSKRLGFIIGELIGSDVNIEDKLGITVA